MFIVRIFICILLVRISVPFSFPLFSLIYRRGQQHQCTYACSLVDISIFLFVVDFSFPLSSFLRFLIAVHLNKSQDKKNFNQNRLPIYKVYCVVRAELRIPFDAFVSFWKSLMRFKKELNHSFIIESLVIVKWKKIHFQVE